MTEREVDAWGNDIEIDEKQPGRDGQLVQEQEQEEEEEEEEEACHAPAPTGQRKGFGTLLSDKASESFLEGVCRQFQAIMDDADTHFTPLEGREQGRGI